MGLDATFDPCVIVPRIASDMGHPNVQAFPGMTLMQGMKRSKGLTINISVNGHHRCNALQSPNHFRISNVSGMPDFVAVFEVVPDPRIIEAVGIR